MVMGKAHSSVGKKAAKAQSTGAKAAVKSGAKTVTPGAAKSSGGSKPAFGSAAWDAKYGVGKAKKGK